MQKRTLFSGALVMVMGISMLSGCQQAVAPAPQKPAEEVLKEGMDKLSDVQAYKFEVALKADLTDKDAQKVNFNFTFGGAVDGKDPKDPKVALKLDGSVEDSTTASGGSALAELRLNKENVYFNVSKLDMKGEGAPALPKEITDLFGKWYVIPLPAEVQAEMEKNMADAKSPAMTPEMIALKKDWEDSKVLSAPQFVGTENIMGEPSYHYTVTIDKAALAQFLKKTSESQGETVSDTDLKDLEEVLKSTDMKADVWVGTQSSVLNQATFTIKFTASEATEGSAGTVEGRFTLGDVNKAVTLDIPKDAVPFPTEALMGLMGGGAMMMDPSMMDSSAMMDDSSLMMDTETAPVEDTSADATATTAPADSGGDY